MIYFLKVKDNSIKIQRLCKVIQELFLQRKRVLVLAPTMEAAIYLNQLLWKYAEESFLPHVYSDMPSKEAVVITTDKESANKAEIQINLCAQPYESYGKFECMYEFFDETSPEKAEQSKQRYSWYKEKGAEVVIL